MSSDSWCTGVVSVTPVLTWAEIRSAPTVVGVELRRVECVVDNEHGRTIVTTADAIVPSEGEIGSNHAVEGLQKLIDHFRAGHEFAGYFQCDYDGGVVGPDEPNRVRYVVVEGRVEAVTPRILWPGDAQAVSEFPGEPGSNWRDADGDTWILGDDGRMWLTTDSELPSDPAELNERWGPMVRRDGD